MDKINPFFRWKQLYDKIMNLTFQKWGILITKTFYGIDDYYKKYSRTKSEFIQNSSV